MMTGMESLRGYAQVSKAIETKEQYSTESRKFPGARAVRFGAAP